MKLFPLIICLSVLYCSTGFESRKLVYNTSEIAYYTLEKDDFPNPKLLIGSFKHPYSLDEKKVMDILGNLMVNKKNSFGSVNLYVFSMEELKNLSRDLSQLLSTLKEKEGAVFVSKFDDDKSVLSANKRTSGLVWIDANGFNIIFGEIKRGLARESAKNFFEWTNIHPISMNVVADENEIIEDPVFQFTSVRGFKNRKWLTFKLDDLDRFKFKERLETKKLSRDMETMRPPKSEATIKKPE